MKVPTTDQSVVGQLIELTPDLAATVLRVIDEGWEYAKAAGATPADCERLLTERLRDGMRAAGSRPLSMVVQPGTESESPGASVPDGLTDIPLFLIEIYLQFSDHDPHAIIECKRIAGTNTDLCRKYVVNGIDRFRRGKYSSRHSVAFMVGYVLCGTVGGAASGINGYLVRRGRGPDSLGTSTLDLGHWLRRSEHQRSFGVPIVLHHAFLSFDDDSRPGTVGASAAGCRQQAR